MANSRAPIVWIQDNASYHTSGIPHAFYAARADRQRDAITHAAGYRTIRIQSTSKPTGADIAEASHEASHKVRDLQRDKGQSR